MELLFIILFGVAAGLAVHYALPWRGTHGIALIPAVAGMVSERTLAAPDAHGASELASTPPM